MNPSENLFFSELLQQFRTRKKLNQKQLAKLIGVSRETVSLWERGYYKPETDTSLYELVRVLGLTEQQQQQLFEAYTVTALVTSFHNPPLERNPYFTGRGPQLAQLHKLLMAGKQVALTQAIGGLGGIGKTQLALEYAYRYQKSYHDIFWAVADTYEALMTSYLHLAALLHLPEYHETDQHQMKEAVMRWFRQHTGWLLILDNIEDLSLVHQFVPLDRQGDVLLTTRRQVTEPIAQAIKLGLLPENDGILFLLKRTKILTFDMALDDASADDIATARAITRALGHLPLALDQAGAYILETGCSLANYLEVFQKHRAELLRRRAGREIPTDHPESVTTTFTLNFQQVQQRSRVAAELLQVCAFLASEGIGEELLIQGASELGPLLRPLGSNDLLLDQAIETLRAFSLIQRDQEKKTFSIHRLVQAVLKDSMNKATRRRWATRVVRAVHVVFPQVRFETREQCEQLLPHALECAQVITREKICTREALLLLNRCAINSGDFNEAEQLYGEAVALAKRVLGSEHPETGLVEFNRLLLNYCKVKDEKINCGAPFRGPFGRFARVDWLENVIKREPRTQDIIEIHNGIVPELLALEKDADHLEIDIDLECLAERLGDIAYACRCEGKYAEAVPLLEKMIEISEKLWGQAYVQIPDDLCTLGELYCAQGKYAAAEPLYERALAINEHYTAQEADTPSKTGLFYLNWGKYAQAEPLLLRALAIQEKIVLSEDQEFKDSNIHGVASKLADLAKLYAVQGKDEQAKQLYLRAQDILGDLIKSCKKEHPSQITESLLKDFITFSEQALGHEHLRTADGLYDLARLYHEENKLEQAEPLLLRAIVIREQALGPEHPETGKSLHNLAALYRAQGKYAQAEPLLVRALSIDERVYGYEHPEVATNLNNLAYLYDRQGKYAQAEPLYVRALSICEQQLGPAHPKTAISLNNLAELYRAQGKYEQAESLYVRALAIDEQVYGPEHPEVATDLNNLALLYKAQGKYEQAEPLLTRALAICEQQLEPEHPHTAHSCGNLAGLYKEQGKYAQAEPLYVRALSICEQQLGSQHPDTATS